MKSFKIRLQRLFLQHRKRFFSSALLQSGKRFFLVSPSAKWKKIFSRQPFCKVEKDLIAVAVTEIVRRYSQFFASIFSSGSPDKAK